MTSAPAGPIRLGVLAYGPEPRLHREATVALLTLREFAPPDAEVIVYTDRADRYRWISSQLTIEPLSAAAIAAWRGPTDDRFRPKLETLRQLTRGGHTAVLADTDTMARSSLVPLADHLHNGGFVLHNREYRIAAAPRRGDRALRHEIVGRQWGGIAAGDETWMWNGGVIGVPGRHAEAADRALAAFDEMRLASRHFALEQLAYSIVFPAYGPVRAASEWFVHYWANRVWFDRRIERFLSAALIEGWTPEAARARLRACPIDGPLDGRVSAWQRRVSKLLRIDRNDDADRLD